MTIKKLFLTILISISISTYASNRINNINCEGFSRVSIDSLSPKINIKVGDKINGDVIENIIRSLYSTNNFEKVKVIKNKNTLTIKVKELPIISKVNIVGSEVIPKDKIEKILEHSNISAGNVLNRSLLFLTKKSFEEFYYNIGKYNFNIKSVVTPLPNNYANVTFILKESVFTKIDQINIIGNKNFTYKKLISLFELRDKINWWDITKIHTYKKETLEEALTNLRNFYLKNGYLRFKIKSTKLSLTPNKNKIYITVNINEGNQYKISGVKFRSNLNNKLEELKNNIKIGIGDIYNIENIKKAKHKINSIIVDYGYAYPIIRVNYKIDDLNKKVKIYFNVNSGKRYHVRHIYFKGNYISKDSVLRRKLQQIEGDWLNSNLVDQSTNILKGTSYFDQVELEKNFLPNQRDQVDLIYKVKEHKTGGIKLGVGYGKKNLLNFQVNINQNNWLGTGHIFKINAVKDMVQKQGDLLLIDPYFTVNGISLTNHFFYNRMTSSDKSYGYNNISYGIDTSLGFPINNENTLNVGLGFIKNNIYNISPQISVYRYLKYIENFDISKKDAHFLTNDFNINIGWDYDTLEQSLFPLLGSSINLNSKINVLKARNNFFKISLDSSKYLPINESNTWILVGCFRLGYGAGFFRNHEMPFYENFYSGGPKTIRGFQTNTVGPKSVYLKTLKSLSPNCISSKECTVSTDTIGGNALFNGSLELIFPIPLLNKKLAESIRTSLFCDFGNVWDTKWKTTYKGKNIKNMPDYNSPSNIRISAGVSFKWASPIGPLEFSYAIPIKTYNGDKIDNFQLYIGKTW
ncbi:outer membrane protein assembly factor BamA [Pantoea sp. SoEX]|uniref:outer membrane protein assembly factor BamA n=1 Tax=Pantoea sp. SoEX TaxID=2576763 RepID=UPI00135901B5|nr:outer membrane protein assembly factor BamA [Pantoea sp. SoEX]MXP51179.1 outer membrane protein assembly factor BamA [Pantoea sp. SoEX]